MEATLVEDPRIAEQGRANLFGGATLTESSRLAELAQAVVACSCGVNAVSSGVHFVGATISATATIHSEPFTNPRVPAPDERAIVVPAGVRDMAVWHEDRVMDVVYGVKSSTDVFPDREYVEAQVTVDVNMRIVDELAITRTSIGNGMIGSKPFNYWITG